MKIFTIKARGTYGGGMAVVAADDEAEATQIAAASLGRDVWRTRYDKPDEVTAIVDVSGVDIQRGVLDHFETGE